MSEKEQNQYRGKNFINTEELAKRWIKSPRTIENWRARKTGPNFYRIGGEVLYDLNEIIKLENDSYVANE